MIVYKATASAFLEDCFKRSIGEVVQKSFESTTRRRASITEINAWANSLQQVAIALNDGAIPSDAGIAIEYTIPQSSKRIDVIISGYDASKLPALIILELKQWSSTTVTDKDGIIIARRGGLSGETEGPHPSYQAWSYASLLMGFNEAVYESNFDLRPCAYLHNHPRDGSIDDARYDDYIKLAPVFLKGESERERLRKFISTHIKFGDSSKLIESVENGRIRPSKALADSLSKMLKGNPEFVLIDDQKVIFESVIAAAESSSSENKKVIIIEGGPGTGKSVLAINLLERLTKRGLLCKYVSKNAAPRAVYKAKLTGTLRQTEIGNLFSGSGAFIDTEPNVFNVLLVDEAHRLNEKSGLYGNLGENQIKELVSSSQCTVFFVDESQRIAFSDIGRVSEIQKWAKAVNASVATHTLSSQFRCNGSDGYISWLDNTLGVRETANVLLDRASYDFQVVDSPTVLHEMVRQQNLQNNKARMVAGYCWEWKSKKNSSSFDIVLEDGKYQRKWNLDTDGSLWIISPNSVEEVGCIHTCQGLEVDLIGVIIGPDLVARNGVIQTSYKERAKADRRKVFGGIERMMREEPTTATSLADEIIKNTYRTLMSRGQKGCYIYSADTETRKYFSSLLT
jgi:DUF2075 family protein